MTTEMIHVAGSDIAFPFEPGETVLDAAERAGFSMPYSCRKGVCSSCKGGLVAGDVITGRASRLSGRHEDVLYCNARPQGTVEIAPKWIVSSKAPDRRRFKTHVHRIEHPAKDVTILHLRLPIGRRMPFRAGQYVRVFLDDGSSRNYSLANPPHDNDMAVLHVRRVPGGRFSDRLIGTIETGGTLDIELPYGLFCLSEHAGVPAVVLATGTGFSPLCSMIEDLIRRRSGRPVHLFWGGQTLDDLYAIERVRGWAQRHAWFRFTPVLSRPHPEWSDAAAYVQQAAIARYPNLGGHEVYACGNPDMVEDARALLTASAGLAEDNFYADPFVPAGDPVPLP